VSEPAGAPEGQRGENFADVVRAAQDDIAMGVDRAGWRDDPLRHPMAALSTTIGLFPPFLERMEAVAEQMRRPVTDDELNRLQTAVIRGADRRAADLARAHNLRTLLLYGGAFVACVVLAAVGGFWWGQATAADSIQETEQRLALAFRDGADAAAGWARLMEQNDIGKAVAQCTGQRTYVDATGRKACAVPLWIEPPKRTPPAS